MAKKIKKQEEEEIKTEELLESEEPQDSEKIFIGYHPITGDEVWQ